ncbi:MAG: type IV pilin protein [Pseudomonadales bacterium]|nr:type IV pilin protein [Pseudomonadales bacterium]
MNRPVSHRSIAGFTLIELMIVVAITAVLASVAYPAYQDSIQKSRRSDAKIALVQAAASEERWFSSNNTYTSSATNVGGISSPEGFYGITVTAATLTYSIVATATGSQLDDTTCRTFTLTQTGAKTSANDTPAATTTCW